jgi:hypothetical protein
MTVVLVGLGALVSVNAMARQTVQEEHTYGFRGSNLSVDLTVGEVQIVPGAKDDEISVRRRLTYGLRRPFVEERIDGDTFRVRDGNCAVPVGTACHVRWLIQVPRGLPVEVTTRSGAITVSGLSGLVKLTSHSGEVRARTLSGTAIQLLSYNGKVTGTDIRSGLVVATSTTTPISLTFSTPPKRVWAKSQTGSVGVILPPGTEPYKIDAQGGPTAIGTISDVKDDPKANRSITVKSDKGDVSVRQNPEN